MRNSVEPERAEERMKRGPGPFMGGSYRRAAIVARPAGRFFPRPVPFDRRSEPDLGDDRPDESPGLRAGSVDTRTAVETQETRLGTRGFDFSCLERVS